MTCCCDEYEITIRNRTATAPCTFCPDGLATSWALTVPAGITGDDCHNGACTPFSGDFTFEVGSDPCRRRATDRQFGFCVNGSQFSSGNDGRWSLEPRPIPSPTHWILFGQVFTSISPTVTRTVAIYSIPIADFDCNGPNTLTKVDISTAPAFFGKLVKADACTAWPDELTITPT